jgi:hypothetical protein
MDEDEIVVEHISMEDKLTLGKVSIRVITHASGKISLESMHSHNSRAFNFDHSDRELVEKIGRLFYRAANLLKEKAHE